MVGRRVDLDCGAIKRIAASINLSEHRTRRLYLVLSDVRTSFDIRQIIDDQKMYSAVAKQLSGVKASVMRVAREGSDPQFAQGLSILAQEGERWAAEQKDEALQNLGLHPAQYGEVRLYGTKELIDQWFHTASIVYALLRRAENNLKGMANQKAIESGPKEWLCGKRLPEVYEQFSGKHFDIPKNSVREIMISGGVAFVIQAYAAIGLGTIAPETISSHRKSFARRSRPPG